MLHTQKYCKTTQVHKLQITHITYPNDLELTAPPYMGLMFCVLAIEMFVLSLITELTLDHNIRAN